MTSITLSELQKNIGTIRSFTGPVMIFDGRKKRNIAMITPIEETPKQKSIMSLAGSMKNEFTEKYKDLPYSEIRAMAWENHINEKYGKTSRC